MMAVSAEVLTKSQNLLLESLDGIEPVSCAFMLTKVLAAKEVEANAWSEGVLK